MKAQFVNENLNKDKNLDDAIDKVFSILSALTKTYERYIGGADGPDIIIFKETVKKSQKGFLLSVAEKISKINFLKDKSEIKNKILKFLMDYTILEEPYIGGGRSQDMVVFKGSEDKNKNEFLTKISEKIIKIT